MEQTYMKEKPILPLLLSMALPMVLSMMVNSLYNIIDSYFVAKINENAMTALSLVSPGSESDHCRRCRFRHRHQRDDCLFSGCTETGRSGYQRHAWHCLFVSSRCNFNHWNDYHHAGISFHVHERTGNSLHGNHLPRITFGFSVIISLGVAYEKIFPVCRTDEDHNVLYDEWMYSEHYSGSDHDFRISDRFPG